MSPFFAPCLLLIYLSSLALVSIAKGQDRVSNGIAYENPVAFIPSAYEFFHPKAQEPDNTKNPFVASNCSPLPVAAQVDCIKAFASKEVSAAGKSVHRVGAGGISGIVFVLVFAVLLLMDVYSALNTRQANANRVNSIQPHPSSFAL